MDLDDSGNNEEETSFNTVNLRNTETLEPSIDDSDEDEMTAEKALQALETAWLNEKFAPELLPHQLELVQCMLQQISHMEDNLKKLDRGDIRYNIHTMEISRIRFIISSYLRKRLEKIEEYAIHLLKEDSNRSPDEAIMTAAEAQFAREYVTSIEFLFKTVALQHMPQRINDFDLMKFSSKPNMNKHVFVKANKTTHGILIPGTLDDEVDFEAGSQHIIQYSAIANLVQTGDVQLM